MHSIPFEIQPPKNEADFERMCVQVYGLVFSDPTPKMNGRRGQAQGGVDVFVKQRGVGRVGIQCKKYTAAPVRWADVEAEVKAADDCKTPIRKLILATTARSDAALLKKVQSLSDERESKGLFSLEIEFWEDICNHVDRFPALQDHYAPTAPGAAYHRQAQAIRAVQGTVFEVNEQVRYLAQFSTARADSANRLITTQLDRTNDYLKAGHYSDGLSHVLAIGRDTTAFDPHQLARWHLQHGLCLWLRGGDDLGAAAEMLKAYQVYPNDEKNASARIRALVIQNKLDEALAAATEETGRFPTSEAVWLAAAQVRVSRREPIANADMPEFVRDRAAALQLIAESQLRAANVSAAVSAASRALELEGDSFLVSHTALRVALEASFSNVVAAHFGLLPEATLRLVTAAVSHFEPPHEKLWAIQSSVVEVAAYHLGAANLLLGRFREAIRVAESARERGLLAAEMLRVEVAARFELDDDEGIAGLAKSSLNRFTGEALIIAAQSASRTANSSLANMLIEAAAALETPDPGVVDLVTAICCEALHRASPSDGEPIARLNHSGLLTRDSVPALCVAAKLLDATGQSIGAREVLDRVRTLVSADGSVTDRLMLAELLFSLDHWVDAASLFRQLVSEPGPSELHDRLLCCYIRSGNRREAKKLLEAMPEGWVERERTRALAIELGRQASDWSFLEPLLETQTVKHPERGANWLLKLGALLASGQIARFQAELARVPEIVEGVPRSLSQLAALELRFGFPERGLRRLYRLARTNLDQPEAVASYLVGILTGPPDLPMLDEALEQVGPGTGVDLEDDIGRLHRVIVDPADIVGLPLREGYLLPDSKEAQSLTGARVGDAVSVNTFGFGEETVVRVRAVRSAYRQLLMVAQSRADQFIGLPHLKAVPVGTTGDPEQDLLHMKAEVRRSSAITQDLLDRYANGHLTVGGLAHLQGRGAYEAALGWPTNAPALYVAQGTREARAAAAERLSREGAAFVVDSLTLAEFGRFDCLQVLALLPRVLVSTATRSLLEEALREAQDDRSIGSAVEVDGQMAFVEHDEAFKVRRVKFFEQLLVAVDRYCTVRPSYASMEDEEKKYPGIKNFLSSEEVEVLLLAKDSAADILTLDGRFREMCWLISAMHGVWPQSVVAHCVSRGTLPEAVGARFIVGQFLANRSFVSVSAADLHWLVMQGGPILQRGMQRFLAHVRSGEADIGSAVRVVFEFLDRLARTNTRLYAFAEMLRHSAEALARHGSRPANLRVELEGFVHRLVENANANPHASLHPVLAQARDARVGFQTKVLMEAVEQAFFDASQPLRNQPLRVNVLFCSKLPWLVNAREDAAERATAGSEGAYVGPSTVGEPPASPAGTGSRDETKGERAYLVAVPPTDR